MSFASTFAASYVIPVAGQPVSFPLLRMKHIAELAAKVLAKRAARIKSIADDEKLKPDARASFRASVEAREVDFGDVIAWARGVDGSIETLKASLSIAGVTGDAANEIIEAMAPVDREDTALIVIRYLTLEKKDEGKKGANPPSPGSPTGSETSGSSLTTTAAGTPGN